MGVQAVVHRQVFIRTYAETRLLSIDLRSVVARRLYSALNDWATRRVMDMDLMFMHVFAL